MRAVTDPGAALRAAQGIERSLALAVAAVAILLFGLVRIAADSLEGETLRFDEAVLPALRTPGDTARPLGPLWVPGDDARLHGAGQHGGS